MKLKIGDRVTWSSAAGHLEGTVANIVLSENAKYETVPWIDIKTKYNSIRLCATDENLKIMRVDNITEIMEA